MLFWALTGVAACAAQMLPAPPYSAGSNGGFFGKEVKIRPAAGGVKPHIVFILMDDYGWADAGWHRTLDPSQDVMTPNMNALVKQGIEMDRQYVYKYCSPTRSAIQSGRHPYHVNPLNADPTIYNPGDPVSGMAAIPRNMTGMAMKMAAGGYKTHMFGKWDAGMATPDHTPHGRGYMTSLHYFHHANDYWTSRVGGCPTADPEQSVNIVDLWQNNLDEPGASCTIHGPKADKVYGGYEDALFAQHALNSLEQHNSSFPYFLFWAPHIVHTPLEVPPTFFNKFAFMEESDKPTHERQTYHAMVDFADQAIGNFTAAAKAKDMWDTMIVVFSADNGGPVYNNGSAGANNWPLKGGKMSNWEGGIRVNSWVSGGFLPPKVRGTKYAGLACAWDWYGTFSELAGIDPTDHRAAAAGLPPIDSHSLVPVLLGQGRSSRSEIPIGTEPRLVPMFGHTQQVSTIQGVIMEDEAGHFWKLLIGGVEQSGWQGEHYPNSTTDTCCFSTILQHADHPLPPNCPAQDPCPTGGVTNCSMGCLFDVKSDPTEQVDVSTQNPEIVAKLYRRLEELRESAFTPVRCTCDDGFGGIACTGNTVNCDDRRACNNALGQWEGFWGPFVDI